MRPIYVACLSMLVSGPVMAATCQVTIGDYQFEQGDIESTSVVKGTHAQAVLSSDASKKLQVMASNEAPVLVRIGSNTNYLPVKEILGLDAAAPKLLENATITIPGKNTSDGLVMQQVLKTCL